MTAARAPYRFMKLASGNYDVLRDGVLIASLARNPHREGLNDAWVVELLDDVSATERPSPFTARRHLFQSLLAALQWLGAPPRRVSRSDQQRQGTRKSPTRRESLTIRDRYQLRLLALHDRFYGPNTSLQTLELRGFIAPTGRTDGSARVEWAITDTGRMALAEVE